LSSERNTEGVREDVSGDSEDGEDDELPCVIGEMLHVDFLMFCQSRAELFYAVLETVLFAFSRENVRRDGRGMPKRPFRLL